MADETPDEFSDIVLDTRRRARDRERAALALLFLALTRLWKRCLSDYSAMLRRHHPAFGLRGPLIPVALYAHELERAIFDATTAGSNGLYDDVLALWAVALQNATESHAGGWAEGMGALDRLTGLGALPELSEAWHAAVRDYTRSAVLDLDRVLRAGVRSRMSQAAMTKALQRYILLSAPMDLAFPETTVPEFRAQYAELAPATDGGSNGTGPDSTGRTVQWQGKRTIVSELYAARFTADVVAMTAVPQVAGIQWTLARPLNLAKPDVCDILASTDWYGMGPGIWPVAQAPKHLPHPGCRCSLVPVFGDRASGPLKRVSAADAVDVHAATMTKNAASSMADYVERVFR